VFHHVRGRIGRGQVDAVALPSQLDGDGRRHRRLAHAAFAHRQDHAAARRRDLVDQSPPRRGKDVQVTESRFARCGTLSRVPLEHRSQRRNSDQIVRDQRQLGTGKLASPVRDRRQCFLPALLHRLGNGIVGPLRWKTAFTTKC
jgi:hypothetical protein